MRIKRPTVRIDNALFVRIKRELLRYDDPPSFQDWAEAAFREKLRNDQDKRKEISNGESEG